MGGQIDSERRSDWRRSEVSHCASNRNQILVATFTFFRAFRGLLGQFNRHFPYRKIIIAGKYQMTRLAVFTDPFCGNAS